MTFDYRDTIISQYANSPTLLQLLDNFWQQVNPDADFANFYEYVWNVETAQGFGLDILGRIVRMSRTVQNVPAIWPVTVAPGTVSLTDDQYRRAILIKALTNVSDSAIPSMNRQMLLLAAGRGNGFVRNLGDMHIQYTFYFAPEPYEYAIIADGNIAIRPAGVGFKNSFTINPYFGFGEAESWQPFDQGVFADY